MCLDVADEPEVEEDKGRPSTSTFALDEELARRVVVLTSSGIWRRLTGLLAASEADNVSVALLVGQERRGLPSTWRSSRFRAR